MSSAARPMAEFRAVSKSYDGRADVVRQLDLSVARGEMLSLLGPSGAGKTTVLMMLAGHVAPTSGQILLRGQLVTRTPPARRGIGLLAQSPQLLAHKSVAANVALALVGARIGRAERDSRVASVLDQVRLGGLADRLAARLSSGQRTRVALAQALLSAPDFLLMDEPLGTLDRELREELLSEIRALHRRLGVSMLHVTHEQMEALAFSDRVAVLHRGVLRQVATPEAIYEAPTDAFVAGFVGENNRLAGRIVGIEDAIARVKLTAGPEVEARLAGTVGVGQACVVCVRPERVALAAITARDMGEDALSAVVLDVQYRGDHLRIRLALGRDTEITIKRPAAAGLGGLAVNQPAAVVWQGYHAWVFAPES